VSEDLTAALDTADLLLDRSSDDVAYLKWFAKIQSRQLGISYSEKVGHGCGHTPLASACEWSVHCKSQNAFRLCGLSRGA